MIHNESNPSNIREISKSIDEVVVDDVVMRCIDYYRNAVDSASFISREELLEHLEIFVDQPVNEHGVPRRAKPSPLWMPQVVIAPTQGVP
jgi:hypothetical protein